MANPSTKPATAPGRDMKAALKEAGFAALVTLGLCIPIVAWGTRQNMDNVLVLDPRWDAVAWAVGIVFVGRLLVALRQQGAKDGKATVRLLPHGTIAFFQRHSRLFSLFGLGFLVTFPAIAIGLAGWGGALKWIDNFGVQILIYVMLGWGLNIVVGLAGLLDLGYVAFYAVGAYSYALLAKNFGLSFWILLPMAGILAAFWGMLLGFPVLRLRGDYLAIVTLAFGEIIRLVLINWTEFSNGYAGISGIPRPSFFGIPFTAADNGFAAVFGLEFSPIYRTIFLYYVILCLALLTAFVTLRLRRLPVGRAWEALREDEIACRSLGINTTNTKLTAFSIGAMFGGFAGAFFSARQGFISPESFVFMESAIILAIVVLGGMGSLWGCAIAAVAMIGGTELLRELDFLKQIFGADFDPTKYRMLIFGFAMVVIMIWKPRGLISVREPTAFLKEKKTISADLVQEGHG
ncbi:branched chain amino acid/phenylalanine ABC transporter membrane subunit LivM [Hyphomicrobiales bacterium]|nr:branched chain amino acid/phenylalanine ABC transporter membrane subunit LivM [Hyphomicrobiales bacterium]CAH1700223.1 branched chain amino acid/phenylalanine ABC transporter membrane subunit LivM [Hyphomicrobiales bacterium]CAI0344001.1 branched chain amino acid/phenylalanine ABC transporter membrane subunit LivM [Hyphomicrobiales bacterium]